MNSRFNPAMRGVASSQQLGKQADDLRADAQVKAIMEAENERQQLRFAYEQSKAANLAAARQLPRETQGRLIDFVRRLDAIPTAARGLSVVLPVPLMSSEITGYQKQRTYNATLIDQAFTSADQIVQKALAGADVEAAAIVSEAWGSAAPSAPDRALQPQVDASVAAITAALSAGQKPEAILSRAMASGDNTLVFALLSSDAGQRLLTVMGADRQALAKVYGQSLLAQVQPDAQGIWPQGKGWPGAAFLKLQQDNSQSLASVPAKAQTYYRAMLARAREILASSTVQANMVGGAR